MGDMFLNGVYLKSIKPSFLRQPIGLVRQEPVHFIDRMGAKIADGKMEHISAEEIITVAQASNAYGFISALSHVYGTNMGKHGVQLSGGHKQWTSIARKNLKDPKLQLRTRPPARP
jgi:ABC-type multidrug transport system fused ATPase/permease subunit